MTRRLAAAAIVALMSLVFWRLLDDYAELQSLRPLAAYYLTHARLDFNVANVVTGILVGWRGFDTLGEVAVLFMAAACVSMLLGAQDGAGAEALRAPGEIVEVGTQVLLPFILTVGAYVIVNGHLSAGGGFQGGAIAASASMLAMLARPGSRLDIAALGVTESIAGLAYVLAGILGMALAGGFLDPRFLPRGEFGAFLSAGAIPLVSTLLGIKVGAELSVIIERFRLAGQT
jgi:multicomponent Na+:H+ antiporter subunit B